MAEDSTSGPAARPLILATLVFPGFELLDVFGPLEFLCKLPPTEVRHYVVAEKKGPVASIQGPSVVADIGIAELMHLHAHQHSSSGGVEDQEDLFKLPLDLLLVPGGMGTRREVHNAVVLDFLRWHHVHVLDERSRPSKGNLDNISRGASSSSSLSSSSFRRWILTVCTGSALAARAGVLDGARATSNKRAWAWVKSQDLANAVEWVGQARWVVDAQHGVISSSGVSAGMDMALATIEMLLGTEKAAELTAIAEYDRHSDPSWDPFAQLNGVVS